jgi:hypothetical protein
MMINPNTPLTLVESAKRMGVSTQIVRRLIQGKVLATQQFPGPLGQCWEINRAGLLAYMEVTREGQQPLSRAPVDHYQHPNTLPVDHGQQPVGVN